MNVPQELGGRFVVGEKIAERPSCIVYRGADKELGNRPVAIKVFVDRPGDRPEWVEAFERETSALRLASHSCLVPIINGGCEGGYFYIAMELLEGMTMRDYLKARQTPMDGDLAVEFVSFLAAGLQEIHEKGVYHGHIDSRAVLFKGSELRLAGYYPPVIDQIQKGMTTQGRLTNDPAYIAPEQISSESGVDGRADIYALSVLLYEMVAGVKPFVAENPMQLAILRLTKQPDSPRKHNPAISPLLDAAILKGLARVPAQRFATVEAYVDAITGGKRPSKNPLLDALGDEAAAFSGTQTIAVSMSTDAIKHILMEHESKIRSEKMAKIIGKPPEPEPDTSAAAVTAAAAAANSAEPDTSVASTVMGMKAQPASLGALVVTAGPEYGRRLPLERTQTMIGSDSGCALVLTGKGVPPRYAIIVRRDDAFFVGALSGTPVVVNGKDLPGSEEARLARGDTLSVGEHQIRFIAPGEVFTLQEKVADRVIDRPQSRLPRLLATAAVTLVLICGGLFYTYQQNLTARQNQLRAAGEKKKRERGELIAQLRKEGDDLFQKGSLVEPIDANATKRFQQILELDPEDTYAKRRLAEITDRIKAMAELDERRKQSADKIQKLLSDGARLFKAGAYVSPQGASARDAYQEALRLDPGNATAQQQLAEINRVLNDLTGELSRLMEGAKANIEERHYIEPADDNARSKIDRILSLDPANAEAKGWIIEMAARSLVEGDIAKKLKKPEEMRRAYLTAQSLGVDPAIIKRKLEGIKTIEQSTSSIVIVESSQGNSTKQDSRYLNMNDIDQRISALTARNYRGMNDVDRRVYEVQR